MKETVKSQMRNLSDFNALEIMGFRIFRRNMKLFLLSTTGRRRAPGDAQVFEGYGGRDLAYWQPYPRVVLRLQRLGKKLQHPRRLFQILPGLQGRWRRKSCGRTGTGQNLNKFRINLKLILNSIISNIIVYIIIVYRI